MSGFPELNCERSRANVQCVPLGLPYSLPEVFVRDLLDVHAKELFGSVLVDVLQEAFRAPTFVPDQSHVPRVSHPAAQETVRVISVAKQNYTITVQGCDREKRHYGHRR